MSGVRQENLYIVITELSREKGYPIEKICKILDLNRSSYYKWLNRCKSVREAENEDLIHKISYIYAEFNEIGRAHV